MCVCPRLSQACAQRGGRGRPKPAVGCIKRWMEVLQTPPLLNQTTFQENALGEIKRARIVRSYFFGVLLSNAQEFPTTPTLDRSTSKYKLMAIAASWTTAQFQQGAKNASEGAKIGRSENANAKKNATYHRS